MMDTSSDESTGSELTNESSVAESPSGCTYFAMPLPDGTSQINVACPQGANEFLQAYHDDHGSAALLISYNLMAIQEARCRYELAGLCLSTTSKSSTGSKNEKQRHGIQQEICQSYLFLQCLAQNAHTAVLEQCIPLTQLDLLVQHARSVFYDLSTSTSWTAEGVLRPMDQALLDMLAAYCQHECFAAHLLFRQVQPQPTPTGNSEDEDDHQAGVCSVPVSDCAWAILARLLASRKTQSANDDDSDNDHMNECDNDERLLFGPAVARALIQSVYHAVDSCHHSPHNTMERMEQRLVDLERTGILAQALRVVTLPEVSPTELQYRLDLLLAMSTFPEFVWKTLKKGTATGNVLDDVLHARDGYQGTRDEEIMARLAQLKNASIMAEEDFGIGLRDRSTTTTTTTTTTNTTNPEVKYTAPHCHHCNRTQFELGIGQRLLVCGQCQDAWYCSQSCQRLDWVRHKEICHGGSSSSSSSSEPLQVAASSPPPPQPPAASPKTSEWNVMSFVRQNYFQIMTDLSHRMRQTNLPKRAFLVEIDFCTTNNVDDDDVELSGHGSAFKIGIVENYIEGSRPEEPDWFFKGTSVYETNIQPVVASLKEHYYHETSSEALLAMARDVNGSTGIYGLELVSQATGQSMVSDAAVQAFAQDDQVALARILGATQLTYLQSLQQQQQDDDEEEQHQRRVSTDISDDGSYCPQAIRRRNVASSSSKDTGDDCRSIEDPDMDHYSHDGDDDDDDMEEQEPLLQLGGGGRQSLNLHKGSSSYRSSDHDHAEVVSPGRLLYASRFSLSVMASVVVAVAATVAIWWWRIDLFLYT